MPDPNDRQAAPSKPSAPARLPSSAQPPLWRGVARRAVPLVAAVAIVVVWAGAATEHMQAWGAVKTIVFSIPFLIALALVALFYRGLGTYERNRRHWVKNNPDDPTCKNLLIVYELSRKALYVPTIATSFVLSVLMVLKQNYGLLPDVDPKLLGGIWLGVFFLNFLVEEYDVDLRSLIITTVVVAATFMWAAVMDWIPQLFRFFHRFGIQIDAAGYLLIALIFVAAIAYSVFKGTFQYAEITPNYINIQMGLAETGEQLSREQYSTRIEAEDLVERLLGFGRLIVTFRDTRRPPMVFLIHGVGRKSAQLEGIRGTYLVDQQDPIHGS